MARAFVIGAFHLIVALFVAPSPAAPALRASSFAAISFSEQFCQKLFSDELAAHFDRKTQVGASLFNLRDYRARFGNARILDRDDFSPSFFARKDQLNETTRSAISRRLNDVEADMLDQDVRVRGFSYEVRGEKAIVDYVKRVRTEIESLDCQGHRYRMQDVGAKATTAAAAMGTVAGLAACSSALGGSDFMTLMSLIGGLSVTALDLIPRLTKFSHQVQGKARFQDRNIKVHLNDLDRTMVEQDSSLIGFYSVALHMPSAFADNLANHVLETQNFLDTCRFSEARYCLLDLLRYDRERARRWGSAAAMGIEETQRYGSEMSFGQIDQFYYFDPENKEPVLTTFVRFRDSRYKPPMVRKKRPVHESDWQLAPGYSSIPIPAGR